MADAWDGRPENPGRTGWHWAKNPRGFVRPYMWSAANKTWLERGSIASMTGAGWDYLGPCFTPEEARALAQAAAEAMRGWAAAAAQTVADEGTPDHRARMAAIAVRDTIRRLPLPAPDLDAIRREARREGMEAALRVIRAEMPTLCGNSSLITQGKALGVALCEEVIEAAIRAAMGGEDE